ncbi:hypothetical protein L7F22_019987 [Adiantum nelumboides]|nr:hypothetical protein [Adiantum nelumboides]
MLKTQVLQEIDDEVHREKPLREPIDENIVPNTTDESVRDFPPYVPIVEEHWPEELWKAVRNAQHREDDVRSAPFPEIALDRPPMDVDLQSFYGEAGSEASGDSRPETIRALPSFIGDYEAKSDIYRVPTQRMGKNETLDTEVLTQLLSTPVKCTITLAELLKLRPSMWTEVGKCLEKFGVKSPLKFLRNEIDHLESPRKDARPVPLNKVGEYCEGEDGNTTLPVEFNEVTTKVILDSGAGIAIARKAIWEKWGNQLSVQRE